MSRSVSPPLPLDIIEIIADDIAEDDDTDSLKSCSLVSSAFRDIFRKHLLSTIHLDLSRGRPKEPPQCRSKEYPCVADYVRTLTFTTHERHTSRKRGGGSILRHFHRVQSFIFVYKLSSGNQTWETMPVYLKSSLTSFIRGNAIMELHLYGIRDIPAVFFLQLPHLKYLELYDITVSDFVPSEQHSLFHPLRLKSFRSHFSRTSPLLDSQIFDLEGLEEITMAFDDMSNDTFDDMSVGKRFMQASDMLKTITFQGLHPKLDSRGNIADALTSDSLRTLKNLNYYPMLSGVSNDPYHNLTHELERMSGQNVLETILLEIDVETDCRCTIDHVRWSQLDRVLAQQNGFPFLRRVPIKITLAQFMMDYTELKERLLEIGDQCFPSLKQNKVVEFSFEVEIDEI